MGYKFLQEASYLYTDYAVGINKHASDPSTLLQDVEEKSRKICRAALSGW